MEPKGGIELRFQFAAMPLARPPPTLGVIPLRASHNVNAESGHRTLKDSDLGRRGRRGLERNGAVLLAHRQIMNTALRCASLAVYGLALGGFFIDDPLGLAKAAQYLALILLGGLLLGMLVAFNSIRLYKGSRAVSVALTLLFGFLHWMPLAKENGRAAT